MSEELAVYEAGEIEPAKGEFRNEFDVATLLPTVGTLSDEVVELANQRGLWDVIDPETIDIREDGIVYCNWTEYAKRLNAAFPLQWGIVPQGMPKMHDDLVVWGFWLVIKGVLCGFALGEQKYQSKNARMTYTDACEGAKSNALMRLCKGIGLFPELWKPQFIKAWKAEYAETRKEEGKTKWYLKNSIFREKVEGVIEGTSGTSTEKTEKIAEPKEIKVYPPEVLKAKILEKAGKIANQIASGHRKGATEYERGLLAASINKIVETDADRHAICGWLVGEPSTKNMSADYVLALLSWLAVKKFDDEPSLAAGDEAASILEEISKEK
jgi:hypothetical protein